MFSGYNLLFVFGFKSSFTEASLLWTPACFCCALMLQQEPVWICTHVDAKLTASFTTDCWFLILYELLLRGFLSPCPVEPWSSASISICRTKSAFKITSMCKETFYNLKRDRPSRDGAVLSSDCADSSSAADDSKPLNGGIVSIGWHVNNWWKDVNQLVQHFVTVRNQRVSQISDLMSLILTFISTLQTF